MKRLVLNLETKFKAAERLNNSAPFEYLKTVMVRSFETGDAKLVPVLAKVLGFSKEETARVISGVEQQNHGGTSNESAFSIPFLTR